MTKVQMMASEAQVITAVTKFSTEWNFTLILTHVYNRLQKKFDIKDPKNLRMEGLEAEDIIHTVFESFLTPGSCRNWNMEKFPDFKDQFYSALDSEIYNTVRKSLKKEGNKINIDDEFEYVDFIAEETEYNEYKEDNNYLQVVYQKLVEMKASDEELLLYEPLVIKEMKRDAIAKEMGISPLEVTVIQKRLIRKLIKIQQELKNLDHENHTIRMENQQLNPKRN